MFPGYVRSTADAVGYLDDWVRSMGGIRVSGISAVPVVGGGLLIDQFQVEFAGQNRRVSHMPVSLIEVAELIHQTLRSRG